MISALKQTKIFDKVFDKKLLFLVAMVAVAVLLPQAFHLAGGARMGATFLPMYIPVLVVGLMFGSFWGLAVGVVSPVLSFLLTGAVGVAMPAAARLPFMALELALTGVFAGLFNKNNINVFIRLVFAQAASRLVMLAVLATFQLGYMQVWNAVTVGYMGIMLQLAVVPLVVTLLKKIYDKQP
jgi:hypothetical protein